MHRSNAYELLLVNKQLNEETTAYLDRSSRGYELDLAVVNMHWLWPTWSYIPPLTLLQSNDKEKGKVLESLDVNVSFCQTPDDAEAGTRLDAATIRRLGCNAIFTLLHRFLYVGEAGEYLDWNEAAHRDKRHLSVKILRVNFELAATGAAVEYDAVPGHSIRGLSHLDFSGMVYERDVQEVEAFSRDFVREMGTTLRNSPTVHRSLVFTERVGSVVVRFKGVVQEWFDLSGWDEWTKAELRRRRREYGLEVLGCGDAGFGFARRIGTMD